MKQDHNHFCSRCILPEGFLGLELNEEGECNYCADPEYKNPSWSRPNISQQQKDRALEDWNITMEQLQTTNNEREYDCVLGYSGGKDSTALLDMLINELNLRPLAVTVNTSLMSDIAKENIAQTLETLQYSEHHVFIEEAGPTFSKLYRYLFLNHSSNEEILIGSVCDRCSDLIHALLTKEAMARDIPVVILGYSPDQVKRYFYEIPREEIVSEWYPDFIKEMPFTQQDRVFFLNPKDIKEQKVPRILLAYHALPYSEQGVIEQVNRKGLIKIGKADPILTNCHVVKAATMYDFYRFGGLSYALQFAELVRQTIDSKEHRRARKKWLRLYSYVTKAILNGTFAQDEITTFLSQIDLSKQELLDKITAQVKQDLNRTIIHRNITKFQG